MGYNAQLVVRSRDRQGTEIIERVKELAGEEGKTYSEMALELLERGLSGGPVPETSLPEDASPKKPEPEPVAVTEPEPVAETEPEPVVQTEPEPEPVANTTAEPEPEPEPVPVDLPEIDGSASDVAKACLEHLEEHGAQSAAHLLANFFADAGPIEGGNVKNILKDQLTKAEYEVILSKLRETKEYRNYRQRVIFER